MLSLLESHSRGAHPGPLDKWNTAQASPSFLVISRTRTTPSRAYRRDLSGLGHFLIRTVQQFASPYSWSVRCKGVRGDEPPSILPDTPNV